MYEELVERTWGLSNLMIGAAGLHLFTTIVIADDDRTILAVKKGWAGGEPGEKSCAAYVGPLKAVELLLAPVEADWTMTPTGHPLGCGWMGGVRHRYPGNLLHITSASAWSERCDAQHALVLNCAMDKEVRFHHVGFRHPTLEALQSAVEKDQERLGVSATHKPAPDHERYYVPVETDLHPNGIYWIEHQFFPDGPYSFAIHWDLATMDPFFLLSCLAGNLGVTAKTWEASPNAPMGVVWQENRDSVPYGIMVRERWWEIR